MDAFTAFGEYAAKAAAAYRALSSAAKHGKPCPSVEILGRDVGLTATPMRKLLVRMEGAGLIRTTYPAPGRRVVEIVASGNKTAPTQTSGQATITAARGATVGWPKQTLIPEQFVAAVAARGRFEDSAAARRDVGWPKNIRDLPQSAMVFSGCGISDVYASGGSQRSVGGMP